jgi:hypothetical protein
MAACGWYSLLGRSTRNPLEATANNFILAVPLALVVGLLFPDDLWLSREGLVLASAATLGGIAIVMAQKTRQRKR